jgi:hypothetical protein
MFLGERVNGCVFVWIDILFSFVRSHIHMLFLSCVFSHWWCNNWTERTVYFLFLLWAIWENDCWMCVWLIFIQCVCVSLSLDWLSCIDSLSLSCDCGSLLWWFDWDYYFVCLYGSGEFWLIDYIWIPALVMALEGV